MRADVSDELSKGNYKNWKVGKKVDIKIVSRFYHSIYRDTRVTLISNNQKKKKKQNNVENENTSSEICFHVQWHSINLPITSLKIVMLKIFPQ